MVAGERPNHAPEAVAPPAAKSVMPSNRRISMKIRCHVDSSITGRPSRDLMPAIAQG
jgi:hypothetical protein